MRFSEIPDVPADDPALAWAVRKEFTLRYERYQRRLRTIESGGVAGAMRRLVFAMTGREPQEYPQLYGREPRP